VTWRFAKVLQHWLTLRRAGSVPGACREHLETEVDPRPIAIARKGSLCRRSPRPSMTWRVTMLRPSGVMNACGTP